VNEPLDVDLKPSARDWDREQLVISCNSRERCSGAHHATINNEHNPKLRM